MRKTLLSLALAFTVCAASAQTPTVSTFDQLQLLPDTFNDGADMSGGFYDGDGFFMNTYDTAWGVWSGFALSNKQDRTTPGYVNQFSTYAKGGPARATGNFMVGTGTPVILWDGGTINGAYVCNTTYTALSMLNGDQFAKKFGGPTGNDPDYLKLTAKGYANGQYKDSAFIYLADYTSTDNTKDYVLDYWTYFDLRSLGTVDSIVFSMSSSDNGEFGMNTPGYFCLEDVNWNNPVRSLSMDDFDSGLGSDTFNNGSDHRDGFLFNEYFYPNQYNFDWGTWTGWSWSSVTDTTDKSYMNQYSAKPGTGAYQSDNYMVSYGFSSVYGALDTQERHIILKNQPQEGVWLTNTTYTYDQIRNGSNFSKKFGGNDGTDPDWFRLIVNGYGPFGTNQGTDTIYLADYRFTDDSLDYILDEWTYFSLKCLQIGTRTVRMTYTLESSDTGEFGMNTPAYFAMDNNGLVVWSVNKSEPEPIRVYPNPAQDRLHIALKGEGNWEISGMDGKVIRSGSSLNAPVNVQNLPQGIYFIRISKDTSVYTGKFVKQ